MCTPAVHTAVAAGVRRQAVLLTQLGAQVAAKDAAAEAGVENKCEKHEAYWLCAEKSVLGRSHPISQHSREAEAAVAEDAGETEAIAVKLAVADSRGGRRKREGKAAHISTYHEGAVAHISVRWPGNPGMRKLTSEGGGGFTHPHKHA